MRIAFDGTTLTPGRTGVGYYTEHLLQHLGREAARTGDEIVVLSNLPVETEAPLPSEVRVYDRHRFPVRAVWMQAYAPRALADLQPDVAHFTNGMMPVACGTAAVVTVHDMSLRLYPRYHPVRRLVINRPLQRLAIARADAIVTVSHSTRHDLLRLHHASPDRVHVVHEAASPVFQPVADGDVLAEVRRQYALPDRFVLYLGTVEPRKNLRRLLVALSRARAAGMPHHLVCAGPYGWLSRDLTSEIARLGLTEVVHFTGYVPFTQLPALYSLCEMFAFPSIYEGFGLPVVEALACGAPVLTSSTSSLAEIAADAAVTVDPLDVEALTGGLLRLAHDADLRASLRVAGPARAASFSWTQAARDVLAVYRAAVASRALARAGRSRARVVEAAEPATAVSRSAAEGPDGV